MKCNVNFFLIVLFVLFPFTILAQNINGNNNTVIIQMQGNNNSVNNSSNYNSNNGSPSRSRGNSLSTSANSSFSGTYTEELSRLEKLGGKKARKYIFNESGIVYFNDGSMLIDKGTFTAEYADREIVVNIIWQRGNRDAFVIHRFNRSFTLDSRKFIDHDRSLTH